jgi:CHAT domain-containing protein
MSDKDNPGQRDSFFGTAGALVMEASHRAGSIELSVYKRNEQDERTLLPYEEFEVEWERVEAGCREVISLLNRANRRVEPTSEILTGLKKSGRVLFELLIPPKAREKLNSASTRNLILYVDEKLVWIPWELFFNGEEFLCRRFAMGRIVRTRQALTFLSTRILRPPFQVLVLADPRGDLAASYREGIEIRNSLDASREIFHVDLRSHPVEISFVKKNLRDYDIVHYAGHADYRSHNPSESGWLLSDGRFRASEVFAMGGQQPMPSLVFCNACQTAQTGEWGIEEGYEQQIFGLANAYLLSGVRHYIGTFWEIVDEQSSYFAKRFYNNLACGVNMGEAVRKTRQEYGEETLIWASYVLYGDPTFRPVGTETTGSLPGYKTAVPKSTPLIEEEMADVPYGRRFPSSDYSKIVFGGLLLALIFAAYSLFYPKAFPKREISSEPVARVPLPTPKKEIAQVPSPAPKKKEVTQMASPMPKKEVEKALPLERTTEIRNRKEKLPAIKQPAKTPPPALTAEAITPPLPDPPITIPRIAKAPKYKLGDSWTLRLFNGQTVIRRIRAIESEFYVLECDSNRWQYLDRDLVLRREATPEGKGLYPHLLNQRVLDFPLSLDKSWEFRTLVAKARVYNVIYPSYWRYFRYQVTGAEVIETPAGAFGAFKIEERSKEIACDSVCEDIPSTAAVRHLWYAPETRFIVKMTHVRGEPWQGAEADYELISLNLK